MKKRKKFLKVLSATAIAAIMATSMMSTAAFAVDYTDTGSQCTVTIPSTVSSNARVKIYQIASATPHTGDSFYDYTLSTGFTAVPDLEVDAGNTIYYKGAVLDASISADDSKALVSALKTAAESATAVNSTDLVAGDTIKLDAGYYIAIVSGTDLATPTLFSITNDTTKDLTIKSSDVTLNKYIESVTAGTVDGTATTVKISDTADKQLYKTADSAMHSVATDNEIVFDLVATIPDYNKALKDDLISGAKTLAQKLQFIDKMPVGIELKDYTTLANSVSVYAEGTELICGTDYTVNVSSTVTTDTTAKTVTVTIDDKIVGQYAGKKLYVQLKTYLDKDADITSNGNTNTAYLSYDNDYVSGHSTSPTETVEDTAIVYTTKVDVDKVDKDNNPLSGATFTLTGTTTDGKTVTGINVDTDNNGKFSFTGLPAGTYTLTETAAPTGYKQIAPIAITITAGKDGATNKYNGTYTYTGTDSENSSTVKVTNYKGQELPGTGGVGTTMFTIGGIALVVVAGGMLTIYMKKRKTSEEE